jgi:hypothetical protein
MIEDLLQKLIFGIAVIEHVNPSRLQMGGQNVLLIAVAVGESGRDGDALENLEMDVVLTEFRII